ncbi:hypothetical protein EUGRSUZ_G00209 [Eucalyptus grandis]|uniref:Uncharacterized protein n=2 Tax=Eucalyptus grandis TaxID=71139 RepID=A0ACC3K0N8_EUCGR|nr:hypothetical protein EUGRSUZ_G00209 [Eucalyptus grandis]
MTNESGLDFRDQIVLSEGKYQQVWHLRSCRIFSLPLLSSNIVWFFCSCRKQRPRPIFFPHSFPLKRRAAEAWREREVCSTERKKKKVSSGLDVLRSRTQKGSPARDKVKEAVRVCHVSCSLIPEPGNAPNDLFSSSSLKRKVLKSDLFKLKSDPCLSPYLLNHV